MTKPILTSQPTLRDLFSSVLTGLMLTAAFPPFNLSLLAWVALIPLFISTHDKSLREAFFLGFIGGFTHFLTLVYWITLVLSHYGGMSVFAGAAILILFASYLALFPALFFCLPPILKGMPLERTILSSCWVSLEYARGHLMTGFPWCLIGYTQYDRACLIQSADLFGVFGISFLIVIVNMILASILLKDHGKGFNTEIICVITMFVLVLFYGKYRISKGSAPTGTAKTFKVLVVQGNIDQSVKWDPLFQSKTMATYIELTKKGIRKGASFIVWPETSIPFFFQDNKDVQKVIRGLAQNGRIILFGSPAYKKRKGIYVYFNRAYLIHGGDKGVHYYDKVHLVPFGEYVPMKWILGFINRIVPAAGDFEAGKDIEPLKTDHLRIGVLICYEEIFPELARIQAMRGSNLLVNITNDAWFGKTSAPYHLLAMSVFRAVENRLLLIRAANTGISAIVDKDGRILAKTGLFKTETLLKTIKIYPHGPTFYAKYGHLFPVFLSLLSMICIFIRLSWQKRHGHGIET